MMSLSYLEFNNNVVKMFDSQFNYLIQAFLFVDIDYFTRIDCLVNNVVNMQVPRHNLRANIKVHKVPLTLKLFKVHKNIVSMRILGRSHIVTSLFF